MLKKISLFLYCLLCAISAHALTLDVIVVHDKNTYDAYAGNPQVKIASMVNWANFAHANSGTGVKLNLVAIRYLDLPRKLGEPINAAFLERVTNNLGVMNYRNSYKPALTVYLTNAYFDANTNLGVCGVAWMPPSPTAVYGGTNAGLKAVSIVGYNCADNVFAHETAHNLGAGHGAMDPKGNGYPIASSRGYGVQGLFVDTMAYPHLYGVSNPLMIFSSPNFGGCAGLTCGTQNDNAAGGIKQFALEAAKYPQCYPATTPNPVGELGFVWSCKKLCTTTTPINIGQTCSQSSCAESFGRTCASVGGSASYGPGAYSCNKSTTGACPVIPAPVTPTMCSYTSTINIGMTCSGDNSCAESFGRTCSAAGGSTVYSGSFSCKKTTTQPCSTPL